MMNLRTLILRWCGGSRTTTTIVFLLLLTLFCVPGGQSGGATTVHNNLDEPPIKHPPSPLPSSNTQLTTDPLNSLLIVSTLDGSLTALDSVTGKVHWISRDKPMIQVPSNSQQPPLQTHYFLPDPKTGSLYMMNSNSNKASGNLRKLPFTIPQLVAMAPCRNSEGLMYTGRKHDVWVSINPYTGEKRELYADTCPNTYNSWGSQPTDQPHCDATTTHPFKRSVLIGKTEYSLTMRDGASHWNVSFLHYSSKETSSSSDYELVHFTSPSEGNLITYDRGTGQMLWEVDVSSPVIGVYSIEQVEQGVTTSNLVSVPFNPIASETLERLREGGTTTSADKNKALSQTTYVGECAYGLYAVPALADEKQVLIGAGAPLALIEGPSEHSDGATAATTASNYLLLGYYEVAHDTTTSAPKVPQIEAKVDGGHHEPQQPVQQEQEQVPLTDNGTTIPSGSSSEQPATPFTDRSPNQVNFPPPPPAKKRSEIKIVFTTAIISILVTTCIMGVVFMLYRRYKNEQLAIHVKMLSNDSGVSNISSATAASRYSLTSSEEITVGKITLYPSQVLGKGCEGTFVFKGSFEGRNVAVKRILPECFQFADREVDLLKESDQHVNVIRYFCTETDGQFRYIALELCVATLSDWVEGRWERPGVDPVEVLRGATEGLAYLHSLRIVHRDVKPANVLLSLVGASGDDNSGGVVRTMISDFGLCKKIQVGRASYSRRSGGVPGTDGWIAPEVLCMIGGDGESGDNQTTRRNRMTYSVDIFSMGCIYYYVLTGGQHPFGSDPFRRQSNILSGQHSLELLDAHPRGAQSLVAQMISMNASSRPPLGAVLSHPLFWSPEKILNFFLDVSDRIEKEQEDRCPILKRYEAGAAEVVRGDWRDHICVHVALDLRKYRTYRGESVRDLLRALRNKKNHYRELTREVKESLGEVPHGFVDYWVTRFPKLLEYTWGVFEGIKWDMKSYYSSNWDFCYSGEPCYPGDFGDGDNDNDNDNTNLESSKDQQKLDKDLWKSKGQWQRQQRWRGGGRGRGSPRRYNQNVSPRRENYNRTQQEQGGTAAAAAAAASELSASTDNYWRGSPKKDQ